MRILFFSTETRPIVGGIARALDGWLTGLVLAGHDVCVLSMLSERWQTKIRGLAERPYREEWIWLPERAENALDQFLLTRKIRSAAYLFRQNRLLEQRTAQVLKDFQPDLGVFAVLNPVCCLPLKQVLMSGLKSSAIAYGSEIHPKRVANPRWLRKTLAQMDRLIVISEYTRQQLNIWVEPTARVVIVHPALSPDLELNLGPDTDLSKGVSSCKFVSNEIRLLTICRLVERKGIQTVLQAIHKLYHEMPNLHYDIVGDGPFRNQLEALVYTLDITDRVQFHGVLMDNERDELLRKCNLFVMTPFESFDGDIEGFGIVFLEAGLHGKPVIASDSGGISDAVHHQETGWVVPVGDVKELVAAILSLSTDTTLYRQLAEAGFAWAQQHMPIYIGQTLAKALTTDDGKARCL